MFCYVLITLKALRRASSQATCCAVPLEQASAHRGSHQVKQTAALVRFWQLPLFRCLNTKKMDRTRKEGL